MRDKGEISDYAVYVAVTDCDDFPQESKENLTARSAPIAQTNLKAASAFLVLVCLFLAIGSWRRAPYLCS